MRQDLEVLADEVLKGPQDHLRARLAHFAWATQLVTLDFYVTSRRQVATSSQSDMTEVEEHIQRLVETKPGPPHQSEAPPPTSSIQYVPGIEDGLGPVQVRVDPHLFVGFTSEDLASWSATPIESPDHHSGYSPSLSDDELMSLMSHNDQLPEAN